MQNSQFVQLVSFLLSFTACQMRKWDAFLLNQKNLSDMSVLSFSWFYKNLQFVSQVSYWINQSFSYLLRFRFYSLCWNLFFVDIYQLVFFVWSEFFSWMLRQSFRFLAFRLSFAELDFCSAVFLLYLISCEILPVGVSGQVVRRWSGWPPASNRRQVGGSSPFTGTGIIIPATLPPLNL